MSENLLSNNSQDASFASRTSEVLNLYHSLMNASTKRFDEMKENFYKIEKKPVWQKILDLRIIGIVLMAISFFFKCFSLRDNEKILEANEFITVFIVGTLFLVLGTYFNAKELQEDRKLLEKENETAKVTATAFFGLMKSAQ